MGILSKAKDVKQAIEIANAMKEVIGIHLSAYKSARAGDVEEKE